MQCKMTLVAIVAAGLWCTAAVAADAYPVKPVRIVVPFAAGGSTDILSYVQNLCMTA